MCHYIDQSFYYSKCRAQPRHIQAIRKWDECQKAKENGHYCPDASPAKDLSGNVIVTGSSKQPGECPQPSFMSSVPHPTIANFSSTTPRKPPQYPSLPSSIPYCSKFPYLEHQETKAGPVAVHLQAHRVVHSGELALVHTADCHPVLGGKGCGDSGHML